MNWPAGSQIHRFYRKCITQNVKVSEGQFSTVATDTTVFMPKTGTSMLLRIRESLKQSEGNYTIFRQ